MLFPVNKMKYFTVREKPKDEELLFCYLNNNIRMEKYQATVSSNCVYMNMYIYVCVSLSIYTHVCVYMCLCIYVCVCVYIQYLLICLFLLTVFLMVSAV